MAFLSRTWRVKVSGPLADEHDNAGILYAGTSAHNAAKRWMMVRSQKGITGQRSKFDLPRGFFDRGNRLASRKDGQIEVVEVALQPDWTWKDISEARRFYSAALDGKGEAA